MSYDSARAVHVQITSDELQVELADGRTIIAPPTWFPRLLRASSEELGEYELLGGGAGIHWPALDEDVSVGGLPRGVRPGARRETKQTVLG